MAYYNNWVELKVNSDFFFIAQFHPLTQKDLLEGVTKKNYMKKNSLSSKSAEYQPKKWFCMTFSPKRQVRRYKYKILKGFPALETNSKGT